MRTITFYSYKGGTGRTLLLANMARLAASIGKKIVALDFDLEAPGLPYKLFPAKERLPKADGLVGWLRDSLAAGEAPASLADYVVDVRSLSTFRQGGWIKLIPAGRAPSPNYFQDLRRLHLEQALDDGRALDALVDLQKRVDADLDADFLLIDARTGITSTNAVTTHVLADEVVALTLDAPEQLEGTRRVLRTLQPLTSIRTGEPIALQVVLIRVPPRPGDADLYDLTHAEREQIGRVLAILNEPAQPLSQTLDVRHLHILHTDLALTRSEFLTFERPGPRTQSAFHVDNRFIARALFGADVDAADEAAVQAAGGDPDRLEELGHYFVNLRSLTEARLLRTSSTEDLGGVAIEPGGREGNDSAKSGPSVRAALATLLATAAATFLTLGEPDEAIDYLSAAVDVNRTLGGEDPERLSSDLASNLHELHFDLTNRGYTSEALKAIEEAAYIRRVLAARDPDRFFRDLALSLQNLAVVLGDLGRWDDALVIAAELAVDQRERAAHEGFLAPALETLAIVLGNLGRYDEALRADAEVIEHYRAMGTPTPETSGRFARVIGNHGITLRLAGQAQDAVSFAEEALGLFRAEAEKDEGEAVRHVGKALDELALDLVALGRHDDALTAVGEAVTIWRALNAANSEAFLIKLRKSLDLMADLMVAVGRKTEGKKARSEAEEIARRTGPRSGAG